MNIMKKEKGVTIVALVVTVILLIIITGITINAIVGDDGLIKTAEQTKEKDKKTKVDTESRLNEIYDTARTERIIKDYSADRELDRYKEIIVNAVKEKTGQEISPDISPEELATIIIDIKEKIKNDYGDATEEDILSGKKAMSGGEELTGTMQNYSSDIQKVTANNKTGVQEYDIAKGYHTKIKVDQTAAYNAGNTAGVNATKVGNAVAANVLAGKTFTNSSKVGETGTMPDLNASSIYQHTSSNATKVILGDAAFKSDVYNTSTKANSGNYISIRYNGTEGYLKKNTLVALAASNFGDATAAQVLTGKTFTSTAGLKVTGTMAQRTAGTAKSIALYTPSSGSAYMHVNGFETGYYYTPERV